MKRVEISQEQHNRILEYFMRAMMQNGLKATTMDSIASNLQMSKRTLYEIFGTKDDLFREGLAYFHKKITEKLSDIFESSKNVMEAIIRCFLYNRDFMSNLSVDFIKDMEEYAKQKDNNSQYDVRHHHQNLHDVLCKGVEEGYFRDDVNLMVQCRMFTLQMESLKSSEELFPEDISLLEIYDNIILGFLRAISSKKGLDELEKYLPLLISSSNHSEKSL